MRINSKRASKVLTGTLAAFIMTVCPFTVYASTMSITYIDKADSSLYTNNIVDTEDLYTSVESPEHIPIKTLETMRKISLRGTNSIISIILFRFGDALHHQKEKCLLVVIPGTSGF